MRRTVILIAVGAVALLCGALLCRRFTRTQTAEAEQQPHAAPDTAELYSFDWRQSAENADACFEFSFGAAENTEAAGHSLSCAFRTPDGGIAEYTDVPVTNTQWSELEAELRSLSLPPYASPDPYLLDAADSCMEICWADNGDRFTCRYNGEYAHELHLFLLTLMGQITG